MKVQIIRILLGSVGSILALIVTHLSGVVADPMVMTAAGGGSALIAGESVERILALA